MRLSLQEFRAMNNPFRRLLQKHIEYPRFLSMGLDTHDKDVLEIGCGSGYGAVLLNRQNPRSYYGIDLMPEQIALTSHWGVPKAQFSVMDATQLEPFQEESFDVVVIFGILHHIPRWRDVLAEVHRVLRRGGQLFIEEPDISMLRVWERIFRWGHDAEAAFSFAQLEQEMSKVGFSVVSRWSLRWFGWFRADKLDLPGDN